MIVLGLVLLLVGFLAHIPILWTWASSSSSSASSCWCWAVRTTRSVAAPTTGDRQASTGAMTTANAPRTSVRGALSWVG